MEIEIDCGDEINLKSVGNKIIYHISCDIEGNIKVEEMEYIN